MQEREDLGLHWVELVEMKAGKQFLNISEIRSEASGIAQMQSTGEREGGR